MLCAVFKSFSVKNASALWKFAVKNYEKFQRINISNAHFYLLLSKSNNIHCLEELLNRPSMLQLCEEWRNRTVENDKL